MKLKANFVLSDLISQRFKVMAKKTLSEIAKRLVKINKVTAAKAAKDAKAKPVIKTTIKSTKVTPKVKKPKVKPGLDLDELLANVLPNRKENAIRDSVAIVAFKINKAQTKIVSRTLTYDRGTRPMQVRPHRHWIDKNSDNPDNLELPFRKAKIKCWCDCPDFMMTWEYALTHHNASSIRFSNGDAPIMKNPRLYPGICKHLWVLLKYIKAKRL